MPKTIKEAKREADKLVEEFDKSGCKGYYDKEFRSFWKSRSELCQEILDGKVIMEGEDG